MLETDDGAAVLFEWQGLAVPTTLACDGCLAASCIRLTIAATLAERPRLRGRGRGPPLTDGSGFEVVFEVSEMVWEGLT